MKRTITFLIALFFATSLAFSQAVEEGNKIISLDIGFPPTFGYGDVKVPPISANFDYLLKKAGPGIIGVGALAGYATSKENLITWPAGTKDPDTYLTYTYILLGARGTYHWFPGESDKIDTYAGVIMGAYITPEPKYTGSANITATYEGSGFLGGVFVGIRYFFNENIGVNAELGYGVAIMSIGGSFKF